MTLREAVEYMVECIEENLTYDFSDYHQVLVRVSHLAGYFGGFSTFAHVQSQGLADASALIVNADIVDLIIVCKDVSYDWRASRYN